MMSHATDRAEALRLFHDLASRLVDEGYTLAEIQRMANAALDHLQDTAEHPYARGTCINCGAVHVAWSEYQWAQLVRAPCRSCGKPW